MAVGRLSQAWVHAVIRDDFPQGVVRRELLDYFAQHLVSKRSSPGAKGRVAKRLYRQLEALLRKGVLVLEEGALLRLGASPQSKEHSETPLLTSDLRKRLFLAMLAEDRNADGSNQVHLQEARANFIGAAFEAAWTDRQVAEALGIRPLAVHEITGKVPAAKRFR